MRAMWLWVVVVMGVGCGQAWQPGPPVFIGVEPDVSQDTSAPVAMPDMDSPRQDMSQPPPRRDMSPPPTDDMSSPPPVLDMTQDMGGPEDMQVQEDMSPPPQAPACPARRVRCSSGCCPVGMSATTVPTFTWFDASRGLVDFSPSTSGTWTISYGYEDSGMHAARWDMRQGVWTFDVIRNHTEPCYGGGRAMCRTVQIAMDGATVFEHYLHGSTGSAQERSGRLYEREPGPWTYASDFLDGVSSSGHVPTVATSGGLIFFGGLGSDHYHTGNGVLGETPPVRSIYHDASYTQPMFGHAGRLDTPSDRFLSQLVLGNAQSLRISSSVKVGSKHYSGSQWFDVAPDRAIDARVPWHARDVAFTYQTERGDLVYVELVAGGWQFTRVVTGQARMFGMAQETNMREPELVWADRQGALFWTRRVGGVWMTDVLHEAVTSIEPKWLRWRSEGAHRQLLLVGDGELMVAHWESGYGQPTLAERQANPRPFRTEPATLPAAPTTSASQCDPSSQTHIDGWCVERQELPVSSYGGGFGGTSEVVPRTGAYITSPGYTSADSDERAYKRLSLEPGVQYELRVGAQSLTECASGPSGLRFMIDTEPHVGLTTNANGCLRGTFHATELELRLSLTRPDIARSVYLRPVDTFYGTIGAP